MADKKTILNYFKERFDKIMVKLMAKLSEEFDELADLTGVLFHISGIIGISQDDLVQMSYDKVKGREKDPDYKRKHRHIKGLATLATQLRILKEVEKTYPTSSIGNVITQIESRINHLKK